MIDRNSLPTHSAERHTRVLAALLRLYPAKFRHAYGGEMLILVRDCLRDARREQGQGVPRLWLSIAMDIGISAPRAHCEEWEMHASYTRSSQIGAVSSCIAALLWVLVYSGVNLPATVGINAAKAIVSLLMLSTFGAAAGLYRRVTTTHHSPFAAAGGICGIVGLLTGLAGVFEVISTGGPRDGGWTLPIGLVGLGMLALAIALLGIAASTQSALGTLQFAPLLPVGFTVMVITIVFSYAPPGESGQVFGTVLQLVPVIGLLGTGSLLWTKAV